MDEFMDLIFNPNDNLNVDLKEMQGICQRPPLSALILSSGHGTRSL